MTKLCRSHAIWQLNVIACLLRILLSHPRIRVNRGGHLRLRARYFIGAQYEQVLLSLLDQAWRLTLLPELLELRSIDPMPVL